MERGLIWLPLLGLFIWLAYAGWNEYQKLEAYKTWAQQFDRAKYDVYAVLGQKGDRLVWGKPTRRGPVDLAEASLASVRAVRLRVDGAEADLADPPSSSRSVYLELEFSGDRPPAQVPFTEADLAARWGRVLSELRSTL